MLIMETNLALWLQETKKTYLLVEKKNVMLVIWNAMAVAEPGPQQRDR